MLSANVPVEEIAEQYLRAVMQCAADSVEPARLQAVTGWQNELRKRRLLQDQLQELKGSIRVMCRVRPLAPGEGSSAVGVSSDAEVVLSQSGKDGRKTFCFDHCFGPGSDQKAVFEEVEPVVESVLPANVRIFAYGQTARARRTRWGGADEAAINPARCAGCSTRCARSARWPRSARGKDDVELRGERLLPEILTLTLTLTQP